MKRVWIALIVAAMLGLMAAVPAAAQDTVTVTLTPQNNSGESGTATLTAMGDQTKVVLNLTGAPDNPQPAHIHQGTCATLDPKPQYPLTSVEGGMSETMVPASLDSLLTGNFAINVHKSAEEASVYYSCGNIPAAGQLAPATGHARTTSLGTVVGGMVLAAAAALGAGALMRRRAAR